MARRVVDDQEDLAPVVLRDQTLEEYPERLAIEYVGKPVRKLRLMEFYCGEQMRRFTLTIGVDAGLAAHSSPRPMKRAVEPEAGFVLEQDYATACRGLFLIRGNAVRSQYPCRFKSARASRLRGRCTENPSLCSKRGMWWL